MRAFILTGLICVLSLPASAETYVLDAEKSLSLIEEELSSRSDPTPVEIFSLGAVQFLRAVERSLQTRYRSNAAVHSEWISIPLLRIPFDPNPDPEPFDPAVIRKLFEDLDHDMDTARATLARAELGPDDKVEVDLFALWFDADGDGARGPNEGTLDVFMASVAGPGIAQPPASDLPDLTTDFDAADVEWLLAYTHFLSAISEFVIAFDPTESITRMLESRDAMAALRGVPSSRAYFLTPDDEKWLDAFATIYMALNKVPDQPHLAASRDHFLKMIERNRAFWELVRAETDNSREWIPNGSQRASLGFTMPSNTDMVWLQVLDDAEAVLTGKLLVRHWRTGINGGVNVSKLISDPPAIDIVTWLQGQALVPYMEEGPVVSWSSFDRFMEMFRGRGLLFMVLLN